MSNLPSLKTLQVFEAAARTNSFLEASEQLFITPSAVSHQIKILENHLGIKLFHRTHRSVQLTDAGRQYAKEISNAFDLIQAATRDIERVNKSDILTIQSTPSFATQWLMPRLARFSTLYEDIDVRLNASMAMVNVSRGEADIVIRYGDVFPEPGVAVENVGEETFCAMCSPNISHNNQDFELSKQVLIHSEINIYRWKDWIRDFYERDIDLSRGLRFDRTFMSIHAAVDGLGVALESTLMAEREILNGSLILPFGKQGKTLNSHKLIYSQYKADLPKIKIFREWLFDELNDSLGILNKFGN